jgi:hypothetical protein
MYPSWRFNIGLVLVVGSLLLGVAHALVFRDVPTLMFYLALDIVFVPVQVLLVTFIIERLLNERERQMMMNKLNMVIGAFFSEVGNDLLRQMGSFCTDSKELESRLAIRPNWDRAAYRAAMRFIQDYKCRLDPAPLELQGLRDLLISKRSFIIGLLQNPNLLEHEAFTNLLWAVCHLSEELEVRADLGNLPPADLQHIRGDMLRAFSSLMREWLSYLQHLKEFYPYIYSLSVRMNPFDPQAKPIIES